MKHLHFPKKWREERSAQSAFHQFLLRYKDMLDDRGDIRCLGGCDGEGDVDAVELGPHHLQYYGSQRYNCLACSKQYGTVMIAKMKMGNFSCTHASSAKEATVHLA